MTVYLHMSTVNMREELLLEMDGLFYKETEAPIAQKMLEHLTRRASERGMVVNDAKTAVMCVSAAASFDPRVKLTERNEPIKEARSMKFLGITLDQDCTFDTHVQNLRSSVRRRSWTLTKFKRRSMNTDQLKTVYSSMIRPVTEYASVAWHSMLTKEQSNILESQQYQCMKKILGPGVSAKKMRSELCLQTLEERSELAALKFGRKCLKSERFREWFPLRKTAAYERRTSVNYRTFLEEKCRTDRHQRSPLNYIRRKLNESGE